MTIMNSRSLSFLSEATLLSAILLLPFAATGQVNTEAMRRSDLTPGFHRQASLTFTYQDGNSEFSKLATGLRLDLVRPTVYGFLVAKYDWGEEAQEKFLNKGFAHLRGIFQRHLWWRPELFAQMEFNQFIDLERRALAGGGLRMQAIDRVAADSSGRRLSAQVGVGAMFEQERLDNVAETQETVRSTNYLSLVWQVDKRTSLQFISYYQVSLETFRDYRIIGEGNLAVYLTDRIGLTTAVNLRYNNVPPTGVETTDIEISNGITVRF